jgi:hypothetical protein
VVASSVGKVSFDPMLAKSSTQDSTMLEIASILVDSVVVLRGTLSSTFLSVDEIETDSATEELFRNCRFTRGSRSTLGRSLTAKIDRTRVDIVTITGRILTTPPDKICGRVEKMEIYKQMMFICLFMVLESDLVVAPRSVNPK